MTSDSDMDIKTLEERFVTEYRKAENEIKQYERHSLSLPVAAVNQLRYAGHHIAQYIGAETEEKKIAELNNAYNHCKRAVHDAVEGIIYSHLCFMADFQDCCRGRYDVEKKYPDIREDYVKIVALQERFQVCRNVQDMSDSEMCEILEVAAELTKLKRKILRIKHDIDIIKDNREERLALSAINQFLAPFVIGVVGAIVGLLGVGFAIWSVCPQDWYWRFGMLLASVAILVVGTRFFYSWAIKNILTEEQRRMIGNVYDLQI